jgi:hypothetical protein
MISRPFVLLAGVSAAIAIVAPVARAQDVPVPAATALPADASAVPPPIRVPLPFASPSASGAVPLTTVPPVRATPRPVATPTPRARPTSSPTPVPMPTPTPTPRVSPAPSPTPTPAPVERATPAPPVPVETAIPAPVVTATPAAPPITASPPADDRAGTPWWAVVLAVLAAGIAAVWWWRRRSGTLVADEVRAAPSPRPVAPAAPRPPVAPVAPTPPVAPALRGWVAFDLVARRAGVNLLTATLDAQVTVRNDGDRPAEDILLDVRLLSASASQDDELGALFAQPVTAPATAPFALAPGEEWVVNVLATLPRAAITVLTAGGRPMFVPVAAVNLRYVTEGVAGQTAGAFAVGLERDGAAKLAPFWLDGPGRMHDSVAVRPHALSLRS